MQPVPDSGTGTLQVSRHETLESQKLCLLSPERMTEGKGSDGAIGQLTPNCLQLFDSELAAI